MKPEEIQSLNNILDNIRQTKQAFQPTAPVPQPGVPPQGMPMDPAMAQGGMPMDPAMAQGGMPPQGMPMDPAMAQGGMPPQGMPMDPAMAQGGMAPAPAAGMPPEVEEILTNMAGGMESMVGFMEELRQRADNAEAQSAELGARLQAMEVALSDPQPMGPIR